MSKRKPYNENAGYVASLHNIINGNWVTIYKAKEANLDEGGGPWVCVCEKHSTLCNFTSLKKARGFLKIPEFCEECMKDYYNKYDQEIA